MHPPAAMTRSIYDLVDDLDLKQAVNDVPYLCKCSQAVQRAIYVVPRRLAGVRGVSGVVRATQGVIACVSRIPENSAARPRRDDSKWYRLRDAVGQPAGLPEGRPQS